MNKKVVYLTFLVLISFLIFTSSKVLAYSIQSDDLRDQFEMNYVFDFTIMGAPIATKEQCLEYLLKRNKNPLLTVTPEKLIEYFYIEGMREGIRPDLAFAQSLHETGNFAYGGDVISIQNNFCGLGTTGGGVKGAFFPNAQIGVRAQIQHLLAYCSERPPSVDIVDPRYELLKKTNKFGRSKTWISLNGKWAVPGRAYGQKILQIHQSILLGE